MNSRIAMRCGLLVAAMGLGLGAAAARAAPADRAAPGTTSGAVIAMPGPGPIDAGHDRAERNAQCESCHPVVAAQWQGSLHRHSFDDDDFATAYAREPKPFCRSCHAPEAAAQGPTAEIAAVGVGCVTCHVPPAAGLEHGAVLAGPPSAGSGTAPHDIVRTNAFDTAAACAECHEFASPREPQLPMQSTVTEHEGSAFGDVSCQTCHMPRVDGVVHHGFPASRDPGMLRAAVTVEAVRSSADEIEIRLEPAAAGHAFPTGDLFRRLVVEVADERVVLQRRFDVAREGMQWHRVEVADDRLHDEAIALSFPAPADSTVEWRVVYERADQAFGDREPEVFGRVVLAHGEL